METPRQLSPRPLRWVASAKKDLMAMPRPVKRKVGFALYLGQIGEKHPATKPLKGFGSAGVLEVIEDYQGDTYRAVYTVRLKRAVYVLHCFKKKATKGTQTPRPDLDLMRSRLKAAQETDEEM
ncbi:MAG TPA: type II toxin-antitoxin system RelE/ParE family toxin [Casimicrobiaceae bacterium]